MSNAFAIAAVTAALRRQLRRRMDRVSTATDAMPAAYDVKSQPPDAFTLDNSTTPTLNLYLYEVRQNTGYANECLASRDPSGRRLASPPLALNLQYLLTAYAKENLDAEVLFGHGMQLLHEMGVLTRNDLRDLLNPADDPVDAGTSVKFRQQAVQIADQLEQISITPDYSKSEDRSNLWTSLQTHYRPSMTYKVTVVLIESDLAVKSNPPVLAIGGDVVHPDLESLSPALLLGAPEQGQPAVLPSGKIKVFGRNLDGKSFEASFRHTRLNTMSVVKQAGNGIVIRPVDPTGVDQPEAGVIPPLADVCAVIDLSKRDSASAPFAAGWHELTLNFALGAEAKQTTALPVAIAPGFTGTPTFSIVDGKRRIKLNLIAPLHAAQSAALFIGNAEFPAVAFPPPPPAPNPAATWNFDGQFPNGAPGKKTLFRLQVDGVESLYIDRTPGGPLSFLESQRFLLP